MVAFSAVIGVIVFLIVFGFGLGYLANWVGPRSKDEGERG